MNQHEGIQCDVCGRNNFRGCRYKCLICSDYDLCSECFERGLSFGIHVPTHPMQSILTRSDMVLYFGGEDLNGTKIQCLTCPYCGELGLTVKNLQKHLIYRHPSLNGGASPVLCPICATRSSGNNNYTTTNLPAHLAVEHRIAAPRSVIARIDEASAVALRNPQPSPTPTQPRRNNSSRSNRNSMDAIFFEVMSHLPDVRLDPRGGGSSAGGSSTSVQALQQIQLQLDHRLARRALTSQYPPDFVTTRERAPPPVAGPSNTLRRAISGSRSREAAALALQAAIASEARRFTSNGNDRRNTLSRGFADPIEISCDHQGDNLENSIKSIDDSGPIVKTVDDDKYILNKFLKQDLSDVKHARRDYKRANRSLFVQALLLSAFATDWKSNEFNESPQIGIKENYEVTSYSPKSQMKDKKSKKKKNKKNKLKKQLEGVCGGAVGGQSSSNVLTGGQNIEGGCVGSSNA